MAITAIIPKMIAQMGTPDAGPLLSGLLGSTGREAAFLTEPWNPIL